MTGETRNAVLERDNWTCQLAEPHDHWHVLEVHHVKRKSQGGTDDPENLVTLCTAGHAWVHAHPARSYELGLLRRSAA